MHSVHNRVGKNLVLVSGANGLAPCNCPLNKCAGKMFATAEAFFLCAIKSMATFNFHEKTKHLFIMNAYVMIVNQTAQTITDR